MKEVIFLAESGEIRSLEDLLLLLKSPPKISTPEAKTYYVDIPGKHGHIDLSTALTGGVRYKNRKIELEFVQPFVYRAYNNAIYHAILEMFHEKEVGVYLPDNFAGNVWYGKAMVGEPEYDKNCLLTFTITLDAYPYSVNLDSGEEML